MSRAEWEDMISRGKCTFGRSAKNHYYVYFKVGFMRYQIGWLWKQDWKKSEQWSATLMMPDHKEIVDLCMTPRQHREYEEKNKTELGNFSSRGAAAHALVEASCERGTLFAEKLQMLVPLELLAECGE